MPFSNGFLTEFEKLIANGAVLVRWKRVRAPLKISRLVAFAKFLKIKNVNEHEVHSILEGIILRKQTLD